VGARNSKIVREIVQRLQHHDPELQDRVIALATGVALALLRLRLRLRHRLDVSAEILPRHDLLDRLQRIALGADRLQPALNIKKALLPQDSLAPLPRAVSESDSWALGERNFSRRPLISYELLPEQRASDIEKQMQGDPVKEFRDGFGKECQGWAQARDAMMQMLKTGKGPDGRPVNVRE
jgi:hypothetical protein